MTGGQQKEKLSHVPKSWSALSQRRSDWAIRAYDRFMGSLSEETQARFPKGDESGEAYVVVFGKTQVGKTTLLLDLMGVTEHASTRVAQVLRGGRESGKSATATAMEYRQSPADCWLLNDGDKKRSFDNDDAMKQAMGELREQMSRRAIRAHEPVVVGIPRNCFSNGESTAPRVRMLDLPGANSAEDVEREHVSMMARRYVPHADLVLLVGRSDDLSFLSPQALALPGIEDWQIVPARFRIVTTYSYTPQSVRDAASQCTGLLNATFFRDRLLREIESFDFKLSADSRNLDRYFPLEIGDSWLGAQRQGDKLVEKVGPIVVGLKKQLHADISQSVSKLSRLRSAFDVYFVVARFKEARLKEMKEELDELKKTRQPMEKHLQTAAEALDQARAEWREEEKYRQSLPMEEILLDVERMKIDIEDQLSRVSGLATNVGALRGLIADFTSELTRRFLSGRPPDDDERKKRFWRPVNPRLESHRTEVTSRIGKEFAGLQRHLDSHWIDEYYPSLSDDFSSDKSGLRRDMRDSARVVGELTYAIWHSLAKARKDDLDTYLVYVRATVETLAQALKREEAGLEEKDAEIDRQENLLASFGKKMDVDMENGKKFHRFLDEEYLAELKSRREARRQEKSAAASFLSLLATYELIGIRNKLTSDTNEHAI